MGQPSKKYNFQEGEILLIDKPLGWTSFDVVNKIRGLISKTTGQKKIKVGHAGTLDPLATGLLIVCTGKFTKKINELQLFEKEYTGTFYLGAVTPSYDGETEICERFPTDHITFESAKDITHKFIGEIDQVPPLFSAIKVNGTRAYNLARNNQEEELKARNVTISEFKITDFQLPNVYFKVICSKGTYIRSLARDFGRELSSGAYLTGLCRTRIGHFQLKDAISLEFFENMINKS
ncbi:MAG: tRNA pseudouridine(55) synthase TruB [Bacteroidales bacterium]|nr:tRNA pseudouridine(55) synthase TruB [Bacteroidales bacterium]MCF8403248.1 tRNA pseudouridine(55) synthase TruB [Bacteroidales bacterium]